MSAEIHIQEVYKKYPNGTEALKGINLFIPKGQFFTLLGPNGAGKSTLVKIITCLIPKDSGKFSIGGLNPETDFIKIQKIIGVASQDNELDLTEKAENLLSFQGQLFGMSKNEAGKRAQELIEMFGLQAEKDKKAGALSGGNKRRLHCALALVHKPGILFLDEPTTGMDPVARATFWKIINQLNKQGITIFLTTQYLEEADKHASEMALIIEGCISYMGSIGDFKKMVHPENTKSLDDCYLEYIRYVSKNANEVICQ